MSVVPNLKQGKIGRNSLMAAMADLGKLDSYTVATVPSAATYAGCLIYVSNGASGAPCLAYSNGTSWLRVLLGAAVAAV